jgi:hypothetical protein
MIAKRKQREESGACIAASLFALAALKKHTAVSLGICE